MNPPTENGPAREPRIVVIGGGSGSSVVLRGLKKHTSAITAIVTMFDSGGSTGILRKEFGYPPLGDLRQCLVALSDDDRAIDALRTAFEFRFSQNSSLNGHNVGNLVLAALTSAHSDVQGAIDEMAQMFKVRGRIVPVTLQDAHLCAELEDGTVVRTESDIDLRGEETPPIRRVFLDREVKANPAAVEAVIAADAVVMGPGDLYTSVVPNLLAAGIPDALKATRARVIYVCNLMTKLGETGGYSASRFAASLMQYMDRRLDYVFVNTRPVPPDVRERYAAEGAEPVEPDVERLSAYADHVAGGELSNEGPPLRHDSAALADLVVRISGGRDAALEQQPLPRPPAASGG